jgi:hypothetical protein
MKEVPMTESQPSVITLQEVALKAREFANFLEDFGFQNPEVVTTAIRELHTKSFKLWWELLDIQTTSE